MKNHPSDLPTPYLPSPLTPVLRFLMFFADKSKMCAKPFMQTYPCHAVTAIWPVTGDVIYRSSAGITVQIFFFKVNWPKWKLGPPNLRHFSMYWLRQNLWKAWLLLLKYLMVAYTFAQDFVVFLYMLIWTFQKQNSYDYSWAKPTSRVPWIPPPPPSAAILQCCPLWKHIN